MYRASQFAKPLVRIDIATGEGFCRIWELWDRENCTFITAEEYEAAREREKLLETIEPAHLLSPILNSNINIPVLEKTKPFKRRRRKEAVLGALCDIWNNRKIGT